VVLGRRAVLAGGRKCRAQRAVRCGTRPGPVVRRGYGEVRGGGRRDEQQRCGDGEEGAFQLRGLAVYVCGARRAIVVCLALARTLTTPWVTRVSVPEQLSWTNHLVPRMVAALYLPVVRNEPLPVPQSLRVFGFLAAAWADLLRGQAASCSVSVRLVIPPTW